MHMADALLSPAVGATMWAASGATLAFAARRVARRGADRLVPLMGVLGAFVFAAQMINFTIPGTGSSGHLGGGLLLAILLGPYAALIVIASVLTVQALFFADGGLLALGSNLFNMGVLPCLVAWPLLYRPLAGTRPDARRLALATMVAAIAGLQLGAFAVVAETTLSGISSLPAATFMWLMQPIHLAIGVIEGLATAAIVLFAWRARPDLLVAQDRAAPDDAAQRARPSLRPVLMAIAATAVVTAGVLTSFASSRPDGLEWSIAKLTGHGELAAPQAALHRSLGALQATTAVLPDSSLPSADGKRTAGSSVAGLLGGLLTLVLVLATGALLRRRRAAR
jgi:cobalt/nickel transport system permease protein